MCFYKQAFTAGVKYRAIGSERERFLYRGVDVSIEIGIMVLPLSCASPPRERDVGYSNK